MNGFVSPFKKEDFFYRKLFQAQPNASHRCWTIVDSEGVVVAGVAVVPQLWKNKRWPASTRVLEAVC